MIDYLFNIAGSFYILLYYFVIYFQAVKGVNVTESEVRLLPLILGLSKSTQYPVIFCALLASNRVINS